MRLHTVFISIFSALLLVSCSPSTPTESSNKGRTAPVAQQDKPNQSKTASSTHVDIQRYIQKDTHLLIEEDLEEKIGFMPDTVDELLIDKKQQKEVVIAGESVPYAQLDPNNKTLNLEFVVDSLKDVKQRHFRLFLYEGKRFLPFTVAGKQVPYLDFKMPGEASLKLPLTVEPEVANGTSSLVVFLIDKHYKDSISPASRRLLTTMEDPFRIDTKPALTETTSVQTHKSISEEPGFPFVFISDQSFVELEAERSLAKGAYIAIDQTPKQLVQEVILFDWNGNLIPLDGQPSLTLQQPKDKDLFIPVPHETIKQSGSDRFYVAMIPNPGSLAFKHLSDFKAGKEEQYLLHAHYYGFYK